MLTLYLRHPGRVLLYVRQCGRFAFRQAARACLWGFARAGVRFNAFPMFRVPNLTTEAPALASAIPMAPLNAWPEQSETSAARLPSTPVMDAHFLLAPTVEATPSWLRVRDGCATEQGLVLDARGAMLNARSLDQEAFLRNHNHARWPQKAKRVQGTVLMLAHRFQHNYFHWLFDVVAKMAVIEHDAVRFDAVYVDQSLPFQVQSLVRLGIDPRMVIDCNAAPLIRASSLVAVANEHAFPRPPAWACRYLATRLGGDAVCVGSQRLYVTRADAGSRRVLNETAVMALLEGFGFRCVTLSSMSLDQQIAAFQSCEIVVGAHGAGLSNLVFCRPGTKVLELSAPRYVFGCWFDLTQKCGLDYFLVRSVGIDLQQWHGWSHQDDDFEVDLHDLRTVLRQALTAASPRRTEFA
jgi:capsular polysaccharide biosynthesis protein